MRKTNLFLSGLVLGLGLGLGFVSASIGFAQEGNSESAAATATATATATVEPVIEGNIAWYDASQWATEGQGYEGMERRFARFPARAHGVIPEPVWNLSQHSPGLISRFKTNADSIQVRYSLLNSNLASTHMPATGVSGFDFYAQRSTDGKWLWAGSARPDGQNQTKTIISGMERQDRHFMMYYPLYNGVEKVEIGVPSDCTFEPEQPLAGKPIVYYGTSIAHGGCASRPGNAYTGMLVRDLNCPVINLGFSGSGRMEMEMADLIGELDASVFVLDCMPNMGFDEVQNRTIPFIEKLRAAHPETPILMVEGRLMTDSWLIPGRLASHRNCNKVYREAYDHFVNAGDKNIYYLPCDNLLGEDEDLDATVDSSHPNDLGMYRQAKALEKVLRPILGLE